VEIERAAMNNLLRIDIPPNTKLIAENIQWAGQYWVGGIDNGFAIALKNKPHIVHQFMMRFAFGWVWRSSAPP
jgi:hypothetical protein